MARRGTRRGGSGFAGRVVKVGTKLVRNVFNGAKKVGKNAVRGTKKVIRSVGRSLSLKGGKRRGKRSTRRRKN